MTSLKEKMIAAARSIAPDELLVQLRRDLDSELAPYRGKMTADQISMLERRYLDTRLLEKAGLPRLSLFLPPLTDSCCKIEAHGAARRVRCRPWRVAIRREASITVPGRERSRTIPSLKNSKHVEQAAETAITQNEMTHPLNKYSSEMTQPKSQGASQAMLYATGLRNEDMAKPQIGIASMWFEGNPCNMHLLKLAEAVKKGVNAVGLVGLRFNTIGVSDGISMGTDGMSYSLQSREIIADSIETVMAAQWYDGNISDPRMRQKHAGMHDSHGPAESACANGLRRHDPPRSSQGSKAGCHLRLPELRRIYRG